MKVFIVTIIRTCGDDTAWDCYSRLVISEDEESAIAFVHRHHEIDGCDKVFVEETVIQTDSETEKYLCRNGISQHIDSDKKSLTLYEKMELSKGFYGF